MKREVRSPGDIAATPRNSICLGTDDRSTDASVHLDAVRGLAALVVFASHLRGWFLAKGLHGLIASQYRLGGTENGPNEALPVSPSIGHLAVIVFFVLSGYFVGGSVVRGFKSGRFRWHSYLVQRLSRLWVVLLPALLLGWAVDEIGIHLFRHVGNIYTGPFGSDIPPYLATRLTTSAFVGNLTFLQQIFTEPFGSNLPLWSISYEWWFYILFPLLGTVFVSQTRPAHRALVGVLLVCVACLCGWHICAWFVVWLFGAGIAIAPKVWPTRYWRVGMLAATALLFAIMYIEVRWPVHIFREHAGNLLLSDLILGIAFSLMLWIICHAQGSSAGALYRKGANGLSRMSYSLYLVHVPVLTFFCGWLMPVWNRWPVTTLSLLKTGAVGVVVLLVTAAFYALFERNTDAVRRWLMSHSSPGRGNRVNDQVHRLTAQL